MANTLGKIVKSGKDKFTKWDSKLNFVIPENMATYHGINGKKDDRNLILGQDNFRFQIGKMDKKNETIYSKEIILGGLEYLLKKKGNDKKIIIQLRPDLARYLCNEDQKENLDNILTFEQEKEAIEKLIKKYIKKKSEQIEIINISDQYPEIFNILKEKGTKGIESKEKPNFDIKNFSSLNLLKYLYRISRNNKKFMQIIYNTKSHKQKQEDTKPIGENESDYYALVEVAIRMYEVIKGINIQGGIDRQTKYDRIIGGILYGKDIDNFKIKDYQELSKLHDFCKQVNHEIEFERVYVTTKEIREIESKKIEKSKIRNKLILYTSLALLSVLSGVGGYQISEYTQKKKQEEKNKELLEKTLLNKHSQKAYFDFRERNNTTGLKMRISESSENMYSDFLQIYGPGKTDEKTLDVLKKLMKQYFIEADSNGVLINIDKVYDPFLVPEKLHKLLKTFISQYSQFLSESGFNLIPYPEMRQYKNACEYTKELKGNIIANYSEGGPTGDWTLNIEYDSTKYQKEYDKQLQEFKSKGIPQNYYRIHNFNAKRYGHYLHSNGKHYDVLIVWNTDNKKFLLAYESEYREENFNPKQVHQYSKLNGELVSQDFLGNRYYNSISKEDHYAP